MGKSKPAHATEKSFGPRKKCLKIRNIFLNILWSVSSSKMQSPEPELQSPITKYSEKQILILSGNYHPRIIVDGYPMITNDLTCKFCEENYKSHGNLMRHLKNFHADEIVKIHEASLENKDINVDNTSAMEPTNLVERRVTRNTKAISNANNSQLIPASLKSRRTVRPRKNNVATKKSKRSSKHRKKSAVLGSTSIKADSKRLRGPPLGRHRGSASKYETVYTKKLAIAINSNLNSKPRKLAPLQPLAQNQDNSKLLHILSKQSSATAAVVSFSKNQDHTSNNFQCVLCHLSFKTQIKAVQHIKQFHLKKLSAISTIASSSENKPKKYLLREKLKPFRENKPGAAVLKHGVHKDATDEEEDLNVVKNKNDCHSKNFDKTLKSPAKDMIKFYRNIQCVTCNISFHTEKEADQHLQKFHSKKDSNNTDDISEIQGAQIDGPPNTNKRRSGRISQKNGSNDGDCVIEYESKNGKSKDGIKIKSEFDEHINIKASDDINSISTASKKDKDKRITKLFACPCCDDLFSTMIFTKKHLTDFHNLSSERQRNLKLKIQDKPLTSEFFHQLKNSKNNRPMKEAGRDSQRLTKIFVCPACDVLCAFENLETTRDHMKIFHRLSIENQNKINLIIKSIYV